MAESTEFGLDELQIRPANSDDLGQIMDIIGQAAAWLEQRGISQWPAPPNEHWWQRIAHQIEAGEFFLAFVDNQPVATLRISWKDAYWPSDDGIAGYVHNLALVDQAHGMGLGAILIKWAKAYIRGTGRSLIRLDCEAGNKALRDYYEGLGFRYMGRCKDKDYTGALYEMKV